MRLIKNEVVVYGRFRFIKRAITLSFLLVPWWESYAVLNRLFYGLDGFRVYAGSHHLAVMHDGVRLFCVKDREYC